MRLQKFGGDSNLAKIFTSNPENSVFMPILIDLISHTFKVKICVYSNSLCGTEELDCTYYTNSFKKEIHVLNLLNKNIFIAVDLSDAASFQYDTNTGVEDIT